MYLRSTDLATLADRLGWSAGDSASSGSETIFPIPLLRGRIDNATSDVIGRCRVVVGRPGSGKSTVVHLVCEHALRNPDTYVAPVPHTSPPDSASLRELAEIVRAGGSVDRADEMWRKLWRMALLSFLASVYYSDSRYATLRSDPSFEANALLDSSIQSGLPIDRKRKRIVHPYRVLREFVVGARTGSGVQPDHHAWDELEEALVEALEATPTVAIFLDYLDDAPDNAPFTHLSAQAGLIAETLRQESCPLGGVLRTVVAAQHSVLRHIPSRVLQAAHGLLEISWDTDSLRQYVAAKLFDQPDRDVDRLLSDLFGIPAGFPSRGGTESLWDYVSRHSSGTPRDVDMILRATFHGATQLRNAQPDVVIDMIKTRVRHEAFLIGDQLLYHVTTNLLALMDADSTQHAAGTSVRPFHERIVSFLRAVEFETTSVASHQELAYVVFDTPLDALVLRELWSARLLGELVNEVGPPADAVGRATVRFSGNSTDPGLTQIHLTDVGINSCILEVVGGLQLLYEPPRAIFG